MRRVVDEDDFIEWKLYKLRSTMEEMSNWRYSE